MAQREYIITVNDPNVWDTGLWDELTVNGLGDNFIPKRELEVLNERPFNEYCAHFNLTDEEANQIKQDPRILNVELQADLQEGVKKEHFGTRSSYTYDKSNSTTATMKNWGLWRGTHSSNPFSGSTSSTGNFTYNLDGTGVDIIVVDTGIEPAHPEFAVNADGTGGSRVVDFDWTTLGVPGTASGASIGGYIGDGDGHGSNCASIASGNTCGWASGASIYSIRIFSGTRIHAPSNFLGAINSDLCFDLVKAFHLAKQAAGNMRPTVCTNSWGYTIGYSSMVSTNWRGNTYVTASPNTNYGQVNYVHPYSQLDYITAAVNSCAAAGVILVGAAGNYRHKIDVPGGQDYNNYYKRSGDANNYYYHRGGCPTNASGMICVGAIDNSSTEQKVYFSETGPRVDIFSPGTMIMGAYANKAYNTPAVADPRLAGYYLNKISGTSQATPNVAGLAACFMQLRPTMSVAECRSMIQEYSVKDALVDQANVYTNQNALQGAGNRILNSPFTSPTRGSITS
jgi:hypothetical protein